jgi:anti-sigma-K factor RskA
MSTTTSGRDPQELRELLAAYALDAVDDVERRAIERLVSQDDDAARELASLRATAAALGGAMETTPPAGLRADVLALIGTTPQEASAPATHRAAPGSADASRTRPTAAPAISEFSLRRRRFARRGLSLVAAAAVVLAVAVPTGVAWQQHERAVQAEQQADLIRQVLADPTATVLRGDVTGGGTAVAVLTQDEGVLLAEGLAELDADHVYQLWTIHHGEPVPSVVMPTVDGSVQALAPEYEAGDGLAVTIEPPGGSLAPTTPAVVALLPG